jgi:tetraacyldisaccharide 4'-kinase
MSVPVIVVGNLTVGGTGKTPLVLWLAEYLRRRGRRPGIVLRGYRGSSGEHPRMVRADSDPFVMGDEAVLLARRGVCPVAIGASRADAASLLLDEAGCDVVVSDDGLQHYRLQRDLEILVVDGMRGFGNGLCLPAGPLREPVSRGAGIPLRVCSGGSCPGGDVMQLEPGSLVNLRDSAITKPLSAFRRQRVTAVAGVGNPDRFFALLREHGLYLDERPYPDHHGFDAEDAASWPPGPVVMTEKDAVKCAYWAGQDHWYLPVQAVPSTEFEQRLSENLKGLIDG